MIRLIITLAVEIEADLVSARQRTRRVAELLGFDTQDQTRVATALSEIARNAFAYGHGGKVEIGVEENGSASFLLIRITDKGPGITDLDGILDGHYLHLPGAGRGLIGAKRLVDRFDVTSVSKQGTTVELRKRLPAASSPVAAATLSDIAVILAREKTDDPLTALRDQNRELLLSLEQFSRELDETNRGVVALYAELDQRAEQLKRASDLKSRFLSNISHELRTPLNSVLALARLLADQVDGTLTSEQMKQVGLIRKSAENLLEIVNDLLDLAKVEAGRMEVTPSTFSIEDVFAGLRGTLRPLQTHSAVTLSFIVQEKFPDIYADEAKLTQILRNLVSNALKYTEKGNINVHALRDGEGRLLTIKVQDTGIGIAPEHQEIIFEEFAQIQNRFQMRQKGTGLGLPLSRQLARMLGGDITVQSELGRGATFALTLPLNYEDVPADTPVEPSAQRRVLVVDDDDTFRYVLRQWIGGAGIYAITEASSGEEALQLIAAEPPDVMVLDLTMPAVDGFAVLENLASQAGSLLPTIVVTSASLENTSIFSYEGLHHIISKSNLTRDVILDALESASVQGAASHA
jgi:signal transduction histidine kinase/ActR/RegA family two-component response regulator